MLMCESCWEGTHMECLTPPLLGVPSGVWVCPKCHDKGVTVEELDEAHARADVQDGRLAWQRREHVSKATQRRDALAYMYHGRYGRRLVLRGRQEKWCHFKLHFRGDRFRPHYFVMALEDGTTPLVTLAELKSLKKKGRLQLLPPDQVPPPTVHLPLPSDTVTAVEPRRRHASKPTVPLSLLAVME